MLWIQYGAAIKLRYSRYNNYLGEQVDGNHPDIFLEGLSAHRF